MTTFSEARDAAYQHLYNSVAEYGATRLDLIDLGASDYLARKILDSTEPRALAYAESVRVPVTGDADPLVALVPKGEIARRYLSHNFYGRDAQLRGQVRLRASFIAGSDEGRIHRLHPVAARWRIGSAHAIPLALSGAPAVLAEPDVQVLWPDAATIFDLDEPVPLGAGLALGFKPNPTGGSPAIPGVRHVRLSDLHRATAQNLTLMDVPTA